MGKLWKGLAVTSLSALTLMGVLAGCGEATDPGSASTTISSVSGMQAAAQKDWVLEGNLLGWTPVPAAGGMGQRH